ncbi:MAG: PaaI family thioesterase [Burkholderiaceae bacterium]
MSETTVLDPKDIEARLQRGPFHQWLGLTVEAVGDGTITLVAKWREEWIVNPEGRWTHGGILATLIDLTADWALVSKTGRGVPTIDLRVDYHRAAMPGDLRCIGTVIKFGKQFSVAEAKVLDLDGNLLASGRGVYSTAPSKA